MQQNVYKEQEKISVMAFLAELPNFVLVLLSAIASQSLIVWLDFIDSMGNVLSEGIVVVQSHRMRRDLRYEYNYGVGKIEAMTAFFTAAIELGGLLCIFVVSAIQLAAPEKPSDLLIYVVALKVVNVAVDSWFVYGQAKIQKNHPSVMTESELTECWGALAFDAGAMVALLVVWLLRESWISWYVSPVISLVTALVMIIFCFKHIRRAVEELMDRTLPEEQQMKILKVLNRHNEEYSSFGSIRSRCTGAVVTIDLAVQFEENTTYRQIEAFRNALQQELEAEIPNCHVSVVVE